MAPPGATPDGGAALGPERLRWSGFALTTALGAAAVAAVSLALRWFPQPFLQQGLDDWLVMTMRINSAAAVLALSAGLVMLARRRQRADGWLVPTWALPLLIALLSALQTLAGIDLGCDSWLGPDVLDGASAHPGRMPLATAASVGALALAVAVTGHARQPAARPSWRWATVLACAALPLPYLASMTHLYQGRETPGGVGIMLATCTALLLLGSSLLAVQPVPGGPASVTSRFVLTVLPMVTLLPALLAWLRRVGEASGRYAGEDGLLWGVLVATGLLLAAGWLAARRLVRFEAALRASQGRLEGRVAERTAELERALARLGESEDRFRQLAEAAPALIWVADEEGCITYVNQAWRRFIGDADPRRLPLAWREGLHPEDRLAVQPRLEAAMRQRRPFAAELRLRDARGQWRWLDLRGVPRYERPARPPEGVLASRLAGQSEATGCTSERDGRFAGHVGVGMDVHDAKIGALELQSHQRLLSTVIDSVSAAIVSVDEEHRIVLFNQAAERIFGASAQQMQGRPLEVLLPERLRAGHAQQVSAFAREGATARAMGGTAGLVGLRANGEEFPIEASISRVDRNGRVLMTAVLHDMTAAHALDRERHARRAAEEANVAKSRFLSHLSHELRTPLNAVIGFSQLLLADPALQAGATVRRYAELILQAGRHQLGMINDLLDLSRIDAGQMALSLAELDPATVLRDSVQLVLPQATAAGISLDWQAAVARPLPRVRADAGRLRQVLVNLLSNAVNYNRPGGAVRVEVLREDGHVTLAVHDTGLGLSEQQLASLFEPFNRLGRETSTIEGTGIGLSLTKRLVEMMGGGIEVRSTVSVGSTFIVRLPAA